MGNVAGYRAQWIEAQEYLRDQQEYERKHAAGDKDAKPPKRDVKLDTLAAVLKATSSFTCTVIAPTKWQRFSICRGSSAIT